MAKSPPNIPDRHDRVRLRGRPGREGVLAKFDPDSDWSTVAWDDGAGPRMCHRFELEKIPA
ncbi:hypothetical protein ACEUZ9_001027 [Paracoccus litorisediminis]|uniref:hypothetical protein n=1 Tax=Paracoccus litorisediminis TaxID=2006130 RepID=UPI00372EF686